MTNTTETFDAALESYRAAAESALNDHAAEINKVKLTLERGPKYVRIVRAYINASDQRSVHCFVEIATGDLRKSASWKAPAKGARGSIYNLTNAPKTGAEFYR
jgi:hypothetical protein